MPVPIPRHKLSFDGFCVWATYIPETLRDELIRNGALCDDELVLALSDTCRRLAETGATTPSEYEPLALNRLGRSEILEDQERVLVNLYVSRLNKMLAEPKSEVGDSVSEVKLTDEEVERELTMGGYSVDYYFGVRGRIGLWFWWPADKLILGHLIEDDAVALAYYRFLMARGAVFSSVSELLEYARAKKWDNIDDLAVEVQGLFDEADEEAGSA